MTAYLMPEDYEPPMRKTSGASAGELAEAVQLARQHPGSWIRVGQPRFLSKPPTSWVSEVNRGQKVALSRDGEVWQANYDSHDHVWPGECIKLIRLVPPTSA